MKIRITNVMRDSFWYADKIGEEFEVYGGDNADYYVDPAGSRRRMVKKWDCVEVGGEEAGPVTVLSDESLGGVLREYREVKRKALVGERVRIVAAEDTYDKYKNGDVLVVDREAWGDNIEVDAARSDDGNACGFIAYDEYAVLEPTDIIYVDDAGGVGRKYRMVDRKAAVGERVIIVNEGRESSGGRYYRIGNVGETLGDGFKAGNIRVKFSDNTWAVSPDDYSVLEPVTNEAETAPQSLSLRPATEQAAENIASLTVKVTELEARLNAIYEWHKRAAIDLRVAREDIVLIEEGVADDIAELRDKVAALEYSNGLRSVTAARERAEKSPQKTAQQIRDEIVERAKADAKMLTSCRDVDFLINCSKRTAVALVRGLISGKIYTRGVAKCAPNDVFNAHIGRAIALRRALGLEVPAEYLSVPNPTEVRVGDVVNETRYDCRKSRVVREVRSSGFVDADRGLTFVGGGWTYINACEIIDDTREGDVVPSSSTQKGAAA